MIINVGFNGTNLVLTGRGARQGACVDALGQSVFGQVSAVQRGRLLQLANREIAQGTLVVPPAGTASDGQPCLTVRDFGMVDQDQSDNVITSYLINGNGQTAQNSAANAAAIAGATTLVNGSDDKLLAAFLDPTTGCTDFHATDATDPTGMSGSQALNELSARANQKGDHRRGAAERRDDPGQRRVQHRQDERVPLAGGSADAGRQRQRDAGRRRLLPEHGQHPDRPQQAGHDRGTNAGSPVAALGNTLATFMGNRLSMSFVNLGCANFGLANPVTVTLDGNQVATAVTYNTAAQKATLTPAATPTASAGTGGPGGGTAGPPARKHRVGRRFQNPSGM